MSEFIFFLGRFHVLVLHLPIGILLLTILLDVLSRRPRFNHVTQILPVCWAATAITAVFTVALGLMHISEGGFDGPAASAHRNYGISLALVALAVWFIVAKLPALYQQVRVVTHMLLLFLVTMTGHYGGNLTHGATYLVEYAPGPVRALAGLAPRRAAVMDVAQADPWHDVVAPMLTQRCGTCHNADKQRGQLDLSSLDALLLGGESGAVVLPGNPEGSDLIRRVTLPEDHENFMPAEGKTPLTQEQVAILQWWVAAGLPTDTTVSALAVDPDVSRMLAGELDLDSAPVETELTAYPAVTGDAIAGLASMGWLVRPLQQDSNGLVVSVNAPGQPVTREMLDALQAASVAIVDLNMASAGLHDDLLALLTSMPALRQLNISNNGLSDAALATIAGYTNLAVLNLYGNPEISNEGLAALAGLSQLQDIYLWGTAVTEEGMRALQQDLPGLDVHGQSRMPVLADTTGQ